MQPDLFAQVVFPKNSLSAIMSVPHFVCRQIEWTPQPLPHLSADKLNESLDRTVSIRGIKQFVSADESNGSLDRTVSGHDFSRATAGAFKRWALAPEIGRLDPQASTHYVPAAFVC
jgi:hypothetical protein